MINLSSIQEVLNSLDNAIQCSVCLQSFKNPVLTNCGHLFCQYCIQNISKNPCRCPICKSNLGKRSSYPVPEVSKVVEAVRAVIANVDAEVLHAASIPSGKTEIISSDVAEIINEHIDQQESLIDPYHFISSQSNSNVTKSKQCKKKNRSISTVPNRKSNVKVDEAQGTSQENGADILFFTPGFEEAPRVKRPKRSRTVTKQAVPDKYGECDVSQNVGDVPFDKSVPKPDQTNAACEVSEVVNRKFDLNEPEHCSNLSMESSTFDRLVGEGKELKLSMSALKYSRKETIKRQNLEREVTAGNHFKDNDIPAIKSHNDDSKSIEVLKNGVDKNLNVANWPHSAGRVPFFFKSRIPVHYLNEVTMLNGKQQVLFHKLGNLCKHKTGVDQVDCSVQVDLCNCRKMCLSKQKRKLNSTEMDHLDNHMRNTMVTSNKVIQDASPESCVGSLNGSLRKYINKSVVSLETIPVDCNTSLVMSGFKEDSNMNGQQEKDQECAMDIDNGELGSPKIISVPETENSCDMFSSVEKNIKPQDGLDSNENHCIPSLVAASPCVLHSGKRVRRQSSPIGSASSCIKALNFEGPSFNVESEKDDMAEDNNLPSDNVVLETPVSPSYSDDKSVDDPYRLNSTIIDNEADEICAINNVESPQSSARILSLTLQPQFQVTEAKKKLVIACTNLSDAELEDVSDFVETFGGTITDVVDDNTTHIVVKHSDDYRSQRTVKFLLGIAYGKWIVSHKWVRTSIKKFTLQSEEFYEAKDETGVPSPMMARTCSKKILKDFEICCYGVEEGDAVSVEDIKVLVSQCGGDVVPSPNMFSFDSHKFSFIVSGDEPSDMLVKQLSAYWRKYKIVPVSYYWLVDVVSTYGLSPVKEHLLLSLSGPQLRSVNLPSELLTD